MKKTNGNNVLAIFFVATAVVVIGGLAIVPLTTTTKVVAEKPSFEYCARGNSEGSGIVTCSLTEEGCETSRALNDIEGQCHKVPLHRR